MLKLDVQLKKHDTKVTSKKCHMTVMIQQEKNKGSSKSSENKHPDYKEFTNSTKQFTHYLE